MPDTYADLEIRILDRQELGYPVDLTLDGQRQFARGFLDPASLPWVPTEEANWDESPFTLKTTKEAIPEALGRAQAWIPNTRVGHPNNTGL